MAARLAALLPLGVADLAQSAAAVNGQQVKIAEWARASLPEDAIVGVNDTGAIAYIGQRRTFDVVGLTTEGQGAAWVAGAGSRFERYERTPRGELPTNFIVYPEWFGCDALLGEELARATVHDHAILGGDTMVAYAADLSSLGSGARPARAPEGEPLADEVDVADLESEAAHGYDLGDAWDTDDVARFDPAPEPDGEERGAPEIADGGRLARARDAFWITAPGSKRARLVMRVAAERPLLLRVTAAGEIAGDVPVPAGPWVERSILLPIHGDRTRVEVIALGADGSPLPQSSRSREGRFASFHYWVFAR